MLLPQVFDDGKDDEMGSALGVDGLISGLDTTAFINTLMEVEAAPQALLKLKQSETSRLVTALQALNTKVASLAQSATKAATASSWRALTASSSTPSVTATAGAGAQATQISFSVDRLATSQVGLTEVFTDPAQLGSGSGALTLVRTDADGTVHRTQFDVTEQTPADLARAITASDAGVSAVAVAVGDGYRLQLTAKQSGAAGGFALHAGTAEDVAAGTADVLDLVAVRPAQDARITLWPGTAAQQTFTSSSNTFTEVLDGVSFTVAAVEAAPVTLTFTRDEAALGKLASDLVGQINLVLSEIAGQTAATTTTDADGRTVVTGGVLSAATGIRELQSAVAEAGSYGVRYEGQLVSPASVGIVIGKDGTFTYDEDTFTAALAADPAKVQAVVSAVAQRVADVADATSDPYEGTLTRSITAQKDQVSDLGERIEDWDRRLALRREGLQATYSALEVTLSTLQSQSSWLASQLATLSSSSSS